jgi:hypothetical protein
LDKVLVKKAISAQYPIGAGGPIMVVGGSQRPDGRVRGKTKRQMLGGALGGLVGVAGALTGQHRSLGGLTQSMISGGAQGKAIGESAGRFLSGKGSRALADMKEQRRQESAEDKAARGVGITAVTAPIESARRRKATREAERLAALPPIPFGPEPTPIKDVPLPDYTENVALPSQEEQFSEMAGVELTPIEQALARLKEAQRVEVTPPQPAEFEPLDGGSYPVAVKDPMANSPIAQGAPPLPPANNEGSALDAINNVEQAGEKMMAETGMDHDGELTENEKALQRTLEQNQPQSDEEEEPQRPLFSQVRAQPSSQRKLSDF